MAEDDAGGFEAELFSQLGGGVVAQLVRVPAVALRPSASAVYRRTPIASWQTSRYDPRSKRDVPDNKERDHAVCLSELS